MEALRIEFHLNGGESEVAVQMANIISPSACLKSDHLSLFLLLLFKSFDFLFSQVDSCLKLLLNFF